MSESLNLTPEETSYFKQLFKLADTDKDGKIGVQDALFLTKSGLPKTVLGKVTQSLKIIFSFYIILKTDLDYV